MRERGWGSPNSDEGTYTVVLFIYKYFVSGTNNLTKVMKDLPRLKMILYMRSQNLANCGNGKLLENRKGIYVSLQLNPFWKIFLVTS